MEEPNLPRPCSTPHSAPVAWLRAEPPLLIEDEEPKDAPAGATAPESHPEEAPMRAVRHDGWTGERMATFLETLADTGLVIEGYRAAGMSKQAAYSLRNRDPVFAAAWAAAQSNARPLVADGILERSITGTVEHYYRDGVLVGERRHYESWLALAVLKRLDKQAQEDRADANLSARMAGDWQITLDALRSGGSQAVAPALEPKVDEVDSLPSPPGWDPAENCWRTEDGGWRTTFPPPPGFDGDENVAWDGLAYYERACTAEEAELLDAHQAAMIAEEKAELTAFAEAQRDDFFAQLRTEVAACRSGIDSTSANAAEKAG